MIDKLTPLLIKNLEAFSKRFPEEWQRVEKIALSESAAVSPLRIERAENGFLDFFEGDLKIDSTRPEFLKAFAPVGERGFTIVIEGLGLGALASRIQKSSRERARVFVVEPSIARFLFVLERVDLSGLFEDLKFSFMIGQKVDATFTHFTRTLAHPSSVVRIQNIEIVKHPVLSKVHFDYFDTVSDECQAAVNQLIIQMGSEDDSLIGFQNVLANRKEIESHPGIQNLEGAFKGVPAIVVSTGPSLDRSIEDIKRLKNSALILAADASLSILLDHGIEPHFVFSLERDNSSRLFFTKAFGNRSSISSHLIAYPLVPEEVIQSYQGPRWVAYRDYGYFYYIQQELPRGILPSWSSVAHFACRAADYFGCSSVALVGQDLSFDPVSGISHATGVAYSEWNEGHSKEDLANLIRSRGHGELIWVEGNLVSQVPTSSIYFYFMKEFSTLKASMKADLFNSTEGGAKLPLIPWKRLSELSADWKVQADLWSRISAAAQIFKRGSLSLEPIKKFLSELEPRLSGLKQLMSREGIEKEEGAEMVKIARMTLVSLLDDLRFICFISQNAGADFFIKMNHILEPLDSDREQLFLRRQVTIETLSSIERIARRLTHAFDQSLALERSDKKAGKSPPHDNAS